MRAAADTAQAPRGDLVLRGLSKHYGEIKAVDDVSLTVEPGTFLTLLGPSGSGKTTVLMAIAGFVEPTAGEIESGGVAITRLPPEGRNFGMVFQGYALFPHLSVADNVRFPLRVRGFPRGDHLRRVAEALSLVQMEALAKRLPRQLSGGQQQRVALARALVFEPEVLLLDEPLSALDKKLRAELQWELKSLHQRLGTTFVYVTHDQEEALSMSDRIVILRDGRIVQQGTPGELYEGPATRFVADFLGKSNFIRGRVEGTDQGLCRYRVGERCFVQGVSAPPPPGAELLVALRPEKIALAAGVGMGEGANAVAGTVTALNYYGSNFHLRIATEALGELTAVTPAWQCAINPEVGAAVTAFWSADASVVVVDDA
ncbi:MAG: ABC transporter ATP-binding protein [Candidatus Competibacterales bacterium]